MEQAQPQNEKAEIPPIQEGNISLILDDYEDIFSDFDPRPYTERALSDDFLLECKRAVRDKATQDGIEIRLLVPHHLRKPNDEIKIKKRLKDHFQKHNKSKQKELDTDRKQGAIWFAVGAILITSGALLYGKEGFLFNFLVVLMEPAGWFSAWTGLEKLFSKLLDKHPDLEFYQKMAKVEVKFYSY